jgi:hypothetical protein
MIFTPRVLMWLSVIALLLNLGGIIVVMTLL